MRLHSLKLVSIIVESVLKEQIFEKILELGATGYSAHASSGYGSRGARLGAGAEDVQIDVICPEDVAESILTYVSLHFFNHYACIAWVTDVGVVRGDRYVR
ncbi:P-II family nitrogen regulator [Singulisphaera sp. PoT]|uniref:P-II family nitrogen regulator n=1 Tax=Singulisphaera sp. PoT TaxID=3411797 RepID=UPI003BF485ED